MGPEVRAGSLRRWLADFEPRTSYRKAYSPSGAEESGARVVVSHAHTGVVRAHLDPRARPLDAAIVFPRGYYCCMERVAWWPEVLILAEGQDGLFTAAQARRMGASRPQLAGLVEEGRTERVQHGIYQVVGSPVDQWVPLRAAWMAIAPERTTAERLVDEQGPGAVVSHRSAARLLGLGDLDADLLELSVPVRRTTRNPQARLRRVPVPAGDWFVHEGLPVTTPAATVGMLAADHVDLGHLGGVARDAVLRHDVGLDELKRRLAPSASRYDFDDVGDMLEQMFLTVGAPIPSVDLSVLASRSSLWMPLRSGGNLSPGSSWPSSHSTSPAPPPP